MRSWAAAEWFAWRLLVVVGCTVIALSNVSSPPDVTIQEAYAALVTAEELGAYESALRAEAAVKSPRCRRPVLRGVASPRPATADQLALTDADSVRCLIEWRDAGGLESPTKLSPKQLDVLDRCGPLVEAAVRAAISHEDACSAFELGTDAPSDEGMLSYLLIGKLLVQRAQQLAETDIDAAIWLELEVIRLAQDYARGRTSLLVAMIATAMLTSTIEHTHSLLDRHPRDLDALATALDGLLASEPAFEETLASDVKHVALQYGTRSSWVPPPTDPVNAHHHKLELFLTATVHSTKIATVCPANASLAECYRGMGLPIPVTPSDGTLRGILLQLLVESQMPMYLTLFRGYVAKRAASHSQLIALRLRLEVLRRGCDRAALTKLATTSTLGDAVQLTDDLLVSPPAWAIEPESKPLRIDCR